MGTGCSWKGVEMGWLLRCLLIPNGSTLLSHFSFGDWLTVLFPSAEVKPKNKKAYNLINSLRIYLTGTLFAHLIQFCVTASGIQVTVRCYYSVSFQYCQQGEPKNE